MIRRRLFVLPLLTAGTLVAALFAAMPASAAPANALTCSGGSIDAGSYSSVTVSGVCAVDSGNVTVQHNLTVAPGGVLFAAFGGSDLTVGGNLMVQSGGVVVLGCEPGAFTCFNDPDQSEGGGTLLTHHVIGGSLIATDALAVITHANTIHGNAIISGGGGGVTCDSQDALQGSPAYADLEDSTIGGNVVITGWHSCWLGVIRNNVSGNVIFNNNVLADPDGNEIVTNTIGGRLNCNANSPVPQVGDSEGEPNDVGRGAGGECADIVAQ
jgi:hypothetical protein